MPEKALFYKEKPSFSDNFTHSFYKNDNFTDNIEKIKIIRLSESQNEANFYRNNVAACPFGQDRPLLCRKPIFTIYILSWNQHRTINILWITDDLLKFFINHLSTLPNIIVFFSIQQAYLEFGLYFICF